MARMADDIEMDSFTEIDLQHPEVLSSTQLCHLMKQRNIHIDTRDENLDRDKLLELFNKTIRPLPQRDYQHNRRGQLLMRKRVKLLRSRKIDSISSPIQKEMEPLMKFPKIANVISLRIPENLNRLKPPPSSVSSEKKTIRLNTKAFNGSESSKISELSPTPKSNKKIISFINKTLMSNVKTVPDTNGSDEKLSTTTNQEVVSPPKKKHKPITWP